MDQICYEWWPWSLENCSIESISCRGESYGEDLERSLPCERRDRRVSLEERKRRLCKRKLLFSRKESRSCTELALLRLFPRQLRAKNLWIRWSQYRDCCSLWEFSSHIPELFKSFMRIRGWIKKNHGKKKKKKIWKDNFNKSTQWNIRGGKKKD